MYEVRFVLTLRFILNLDIATGCCFSGLSAGSNGFSHMKIQDRCVECPPLNYGSVCSSRCLEGYYDSKCRQWCRCYTNEICYFQVGCQNNENVPSKSTSTVAVTRDDSSNNIQANYIAINGAWVTILVISIICISLYKRYRSSRQVEESNIYMPAISASVPTINDVYCTLNDNLYEDIQDLYVMQFTNNQEQMYSSQYLQDDVHIRFSSIPMNDDE